MEGKRDILFSEYIIDGKPSEARPADMLKECMPAPKWEEFLSGWTKTAEGAGVGAVIDETEDRTPVNFSYDCGKIHEYAEKVMEKLRDEGKKRPISIEHPFSLTRIALAESILDAIWKEGHFSLNNLEVSATWETDEGPVGNMAAFYASVESASEYIFDLGTKLCSLEISQKKGQHNVAFMVTGASNWLPFKDIEPEEDFISEGLTTPEADSDGKQDQIWIKESRKCSATVMDSCEGDCPGDSWLIYIPFDTCPHRLGGSALAETLGSGNGSAPEIMDPDYFIDCFEVVRELVEDGIVLSGVTVARGGLMAATARILGYSSAGKASLEMDISGIEKAYMDEDIVRLLFAEIPGVLLQVSDRDYDYIDAQLLLQDIAYYPVGHPRPMARGKGRSPMPDIRFQGGRSGLAAILAALMAGQSSEGED